jgi:hypothetical protein
MRELTITQFQRAGIERHARDGDLSNLSELTPHDGRELARVPAFAAAAASDVQSIQGGFYDAANSRYVVLGTQTNHLKSAYMSSAWSGNGPYTLTTATYGLTGRHKQNAVYWGGNLWVVASDSKVYRGSSYTTTITEFYGTADALILAPWGGRMYLATTDGTIKRQNDADDDFETYYSPVGDLDIRFMAPFRGYLLLADRLDNGSLALYSLSGSSPPELHLIATVPGTGDLPFYANVFKIHNDDFYFSPGLYRDPADTRGYRFYRFNGSVVEPIGSIETLGTDTNVSGLLSWRDHLLFYDADKTSRTIYTLVGDEFTQFASDTFTCDPSFTPFIAILGEELYATMYDDGEKYQHAGSVGLQDGHVETAWLDMGAPTKHKRLARLSVLMDDLATDFKVIIKYRKDDETAWTTATTANGNRRPSVDVSTTFYNLQVRVELDDDTGNNEDIRLQAISILYRMAD